MTGWLDALIQGVLLGGLYALFAAGLSLMFGVMRLVNLAHGDLIVLAAFAILVAASKLGLDPFVAVLVAIPILFAVGFVLQHVLLQVFSADSQRLRSGTIETASIPLGGGIAVGVVPLLTLVSAIAVIVFLNFIFYRTPIGRAFRATSDDLEVAQLMGIDVNRIFAVAMGLAFVVIAIAALYLGLRANFDPTIGPARLLYAFEAVIIGGLGSFWGTLAGGLVLGLAQTIGAHIDPEWQILSGHVAFLVVLV